MGKFAEVNFQDGSVIIEPYIDEYLKNCGFRQIYKQDGLVLDKIYYFDDKNKYIDIQINKTNLHAFIISKNCEQEIFKLPNLFGYLNIEKGTEFEKFLDKCYEEIFKEE